ncbi:MAG: hypothetical protein ACR2G3_08440 [Solirubrobacterales bacterium]
MDAPAANPNNVLLTGTGRSGTTLSCHLLSRLPETVALFEPMRVKKFAELKTREKICDSIDAFCAQQRASLHERGVATTKQSGGVMPDNPFGSERTSEGLRKKFVSKGEVAIDKPLGPDFTLIVKHISAFTALLPQLVERFRVYAIVRNPLPVLASWSSIDFNLRKGHIPAAERIDRELREALAGIDDPLDRQIYLMGWFHGRFRSILPDESVITYESIIESGGSALSVITPRAAELSEPLESRNLSQMYDRSTLEAIGERLLRSEGAHWQSYDRESVERLLELSLSGDR